MECLMWNGVWQCVYGMLQTYLHGMFDVEWCMVMCIWNVADVSPWNV